MRGLVAVRRGRLIAAAIGAALLAVWAAGATWCLFASDTLSAGLLARQTAIQYAYEDRIGDLRTRLDRVSTQKLIEQESLNVRLHELAARQLKIEARQVVVNRLAAQAGATAIGAGPAAADDLSAADDLAPVITLAPRHAKPLPVPDLLDLRLGREPAEPSRDRPAPAPQDRLDRSIKLVEAAQLRSIEALRRGSDGLALGLRTAIAATGLEPERLEPRGARGGVGGPFVPLPSGSDADGFELAAAQAQNSLMQLTRLRQASAALPLARPTSGEADLTSGFGMRIDPFTRGPAMHTGLDFKAEYGADARRPPPARWPRPNIRAATVAWSRSTTATASRPATPTSPRSGSWSARRLRPARSSAASARPAARPAPISITRPVSTACPSTRGASCAPGRDFAARQSRRCRKRAPASARPRGCSEAGQGLFSRRRLSR